MSKKKGFNNKQYRTTHNKTFSPSEKADVFDSLSLCETAVVLSYHLSGLFNSMVDEMNGSEAERKEIIEVLTKIPRMKIVDLLVIKTATKITTISQLLEIAQKLDSFKVTPFIETYLELGKYWVHYMLPPNPVVRLLTFSDETCEEIGKGLCQDNFAILTPYGVLWNLEERED